MESDFISSVRVSGDFIGASQGEGEDPPPGPVGERVGLPVVPDGPRAGSAAAGSPPATGLEPQCPAGVSPRALSGANKPQCKICPNSYGSMGASKTNYDQDSFTLKDQI